MKIRCPRCGQETQFENNPFRPFCGERCRVTDLGNWLSGAYGVPAGSEDEAEEDGMKPPAEDPEIR